MAAWQLLFSYYILDKCMDSVQIHCIEINLTVLTVEMSAKAIWKGKIHQNLMHQI